MYILTGQHGRLEIDPLKGKFNLLPIEENFPAVKEASLQVIYRHSDRTEKILSQSWQPLTAEEDLLEEGRLRLITGPHPGDLWVTIEFAAGGNHPLPCWRLRLENQGAHSLTINRLEMLNSGGSRDHSGFAFPNAARPDELRFFGNGWQSWSPSTSYAGREAMRTSRLGRLQFPMIVNPGTPYLRMRGYFSADFFGTLHSSSAQAGMLLGFLSQKEQFGSLEVVLFDRPSLRLWANGDEVLLPPGGSLNTDWAVWMPFSTRTADPLAPYLEAVTLEHNVRLPPEVPTGWCSWYHFFTNVTAGNIRENLQSLSAMRSQLPLELLQIDDGFERQVGDWFDFKDTFPEGVAGLAAEIRSAGLTPGLWLAPFIVHPRSDLARSHPQYLLRTAKGKPVNAGFVWNTFGQALDLTVPEALEHAKKVVATAAHEWGYPYLKLDFLYAAALAGRYSDPTHTRAQVLRAGMEALRQAAGSQTFLLGCGAPLGSVLGLVEAMRVSADVAPYWHPQYAGLQAPFKQEPAMPSARNAIHNTLTRAPLHRRWWLNDPDCLLVRPDSKLTLAEIHSLATIIALTGGATLLSDDLPRLPAERLRIAQVLLPVIGRRGEVIDLLENNPPQLIRLDLEGPAGKWHLAARINWNDRPLEWSFKPADFNLDGRDYYLHEFWTGHVDTCRADNPCRQPLIPPHGTALLAVYPRQAGRTAYLGSNLHVSQGSEVASLREENQQITLLLRLERAFSGYCDLTLPHTPIAANLEGNPVQWEKLPDERYRFFVQTDTAQPANLRIRY